MLLSRWAATLAAAALAGAPASAYEVTRGAVSTPTVDAYGEACFDVSARGGVHAVATAHGVVTAALWNPPHAVIGGGRGAPPNQTFHDLHTGSGTDFRVCVGGVERPVVSGRVAYTLHAHGLDGEIVQVLVCTFSRDAAPACV